MARRKRVVEVSGASDVDRAAEASASVTSICNAGGARGDGGAAEADHAAVSLGTAVPEVIANGSDDGDPFATTNRSVPGTAFVVPNVRVGGKAVVLKDLMDPRTTFWATDAPHNVYPRDAADVSDFPAEA